MEDILNIVTDIQQKVTVNAPIKKGECLPPAKEGDWHEYHALDDQQSVGFNQVFIHLSQQLEAIHKDTCKAVEHKIALPELPAPMTCQLNQETGEMEVQSMSVETQTQLGFIPPWVLPLIGEEIVKGVTSFVVQKLLEWLFKTTQHQQKDTLTRICQLEAAQCSVLLPDPSAVWNTEGYYLFFHWKIDNPQTQAEKEWRNHPTQLAAPIDELINPTNADGIWETYFSGIYKILGDQWGEVRSANKAKRSPLYKGWFLDVEEGKRFFRSIENLTQIPYDTKNNPTFPLKENQSVELVNQGKKFVLRKVCIGLKHTDSDKVEILQAYSPPKP